MNVETKFVYRVMYPLIAVACAVEVYRVSYEAKNYKGIEDLKQEIKQKDPRRYDSFKNDGVYRGSFIDWQYEVNKMNDSLKADSLAKRAYFEGAQMVRDSIKNTERVK